MRGGIGGSRSPPRKHACATRLECDGLGRIFQVGLPAGRLPISIPLQAGLLPLPVFSRHVGTPSRVALSALVFRRWRQALGALVIVPPLTAFGLGPLEELRHSGQSLAKSHDRSSSMPRSCAVSAILSGSRMTTGAPDTFIGPGSRRRRPRHRAAFWFGVHRQFTSQTRPRPWPQPRSGRPRQRGAPRSGRSSACAP
jgi:hypothetical protein